MAEPIQGVPEGLKEEALPSTNAVQGVPEGLTEETLPKAVSAAPAKTAEQPTTMWGAVKHMVAHPVEAVETAHDIYSRMATPPSPEATIKEEQITPTVKRQTVVPGELAGDAYLKGIAKTGPTTGRRIAGVAGELALMPLGMASGAYEDVKTGHVPLVHSMITAPAEDQFKKAQEAAAKNRMLEAYGHTLAGEIPLIGPLVAGLGEEAGTGDIAGAVTQAAALEAGGKLVRESMPGGSFAGVDTVKGESPIPTIKAAASAPVRAVSRVLKPAAPVVPYGVGAAVGSVIGHPWLGIIAARMALPTDVVKNILEKGSTVGLPKDVADVVHLDNKAIELEKAAAKTQEEVDRYNKSVKRGVRPPEDVVKANQKAQNAAAEARFHADTAKEAAERAQTERENTVEGERRNAPETPTEDVTAKPALKQLGAPEPKESPIPKINVKTPGQVQPETDEGALRDLKVEGGKVVEKTPAEKLPRLLQEALKPEAPKAEAAKAPEAPAVERRKETTPVETERRGMAPNLQALWQENAFGKKAEGDVGTKVRADNPEPTGRNGGNERRALPRDQQEARAASDKLFTQARTELGENASSDDITKRMEELKSAAKPTLPTEEKTSYTAKKEEVEPVGAETKGTHDENGVRKNPSNVRKMGEELSTEAQAVQHKALESISSLSNDNLDKMARELGINPNDPIYSRAKEMRGEGREQTGRIRQANAILERMNSDEIVKAASKTAEINERPEAANWARAKRAEEVFKERLAGAQQAEGYGAKNTGVTKEQYEAARKAAQEKIGGTLGSNGGNLPLKEWAIQAKYHLEAGAREFADWSKKMVESLGESIRPHLEQLWRDATSKAQVDAHNENGGSTFHPTKGDLNGKPAFSVGGEPEFKSPDLKMTTDGKELTTAQRDEFANRPAVKEALDKHKDASIGTWYDKETDKTTIELVKTPTDRAEAIAMGTRNGEKAIYDLEKGEEIKTGGTGEGPFPEKIERPTTKGKEMPTGDALVKKYGLSSGDPKDATLILDDGRVVANTGVDHDQMLGGKATDKNPPRERFVEEGNIRVRPHQGTAGREVAFSIPESGVNASQLAAMQKMSPQLRAGAVLIEVGKPGGKYEAIPYGEATNERIAQAIKNITGKGEQPKSLGSAAAGASLAEQSPLTPKELQERLPDLAKNNLTEQEKEGLTTNKAGKPRDTSKFVNTLMNKIPTIQEYVDIAKLGEGARKWYQRSKQAFDGLVAAAPDYFGKEGDQDRFIGMLAGSSPRQSVAMNLRESLAGWKNWVDAGRPELSVDKWKQFVKEARDGYMDAGKPEGMSTKQFRAALTDARKMLREAKGEEPDSPVFDTEGLDEETSADKDFWDYKPDNVSQENWDHMKENLRGKTVWDFRPSGDEWKHEKMMSESFTPATSKVPNIIKALQGEDLWPDLSKNAAFKVPSFSRNLKGWLNYVTNDGWMALFGDLKPTDITSPDSYHPLAVATREAAKILGWEPAEAQAAIWSFTQALTERGERDPNVIREQSEDFADLLANDPETQKLLEDLGVNREQLAKHLRESVEAKPAVTTGTAATTAHSVRQLEERIREARGKNAIPPSKSAQGSLFNDSNFREAPAGEQRSRLSDESTGFNPDKFRTQTDEPLTKLGKKKSPYGNIR